MNKRTHLAAWVLQALLAFVFISAGAQKIAGEDVMVELFEDIGAGQWLRYFVGGAEVAGGIGLLVPRLRASAAAGLVLLMIGATVTNVLVISENTISTVILGFMATTVLAVRRAELPRRKSAQTPGLL